MSSLRRFVRRRRAALARFLLVCLFVAVYFYWTTAVRARWSFARPTMKNLCYEEIHNNTGEFEKWLCPPGSSSNDLPVLSAEVAGVKPPLQTRQVEKVAIVSTYVPTRCGIATYAAHLYEAMSVSLQQSGASLQVDVVAVDTSPVHKPAPNYPKEVFHSFKKNNRTSHREAGKLLARLEYDVVMLQFEYGLYGGLEAAWILELLQEIPDTTRVQVVMHTVEPNMKVEPKRMFQELIRLSDEFIGLSIPMCDVMDEYLGQVANRRGSKAKCAVIPHGAPKLLADGVELTSEKRRARSRKDISADWIIMLSSGLLSCKKGFEVVIRALPSILAVNSRVHYVVAGQQHPDSLAYCDYIKDLKDLAAKMGVSEHVHFDVQYQSDAGLQEYFVAADFVVAPYSVLRQTSSGTVPLAMAAGAIVVTSPFLHGISLLADGRGLVVDMKKQKELVSIITDMVSSEERMLRMAEKAREYSRTFAWDVVGQAHVDAFMQPLPKGSGRIADQGNNPVTYPEPEKASFVKGVSVINRENVTDVDVVAYDNLANSHFHLFQVAGCYIHIAGPYWRSAQLRAGTGSNYTSWYSKRRTTKHYVAEDYYVSWASKVEPAVRLIQSVFLAADGTVEFKYKAVPLLDGVKVTGIVTGLKYLSNPTITPFRYKQDRGRVTLHQGHSPLSVSGPIAVVTKGSSPQSRIMISGFKGSLGPDCMTWEVGQAEVLDGSGEMFKALEVSVSCDWPSECKDWENDGVDYVAVTHMVPKSSVPVVASHKFHARLTSCSSPLHLT